jgi:hypothetical protein
VLEPYEDQLSTFKRDAVDGVDLFADKGAGVLGQLCGGVASPLCESVRDSSNDLFVTTYSFSAADENSRTIPEVFRLTGS